MLSRKKAIRIQNVCSGKCFKKQLRTFDEEDTSKKPAERFCLLIDNVLLFFVGIFVGDFLLEFFVGVFVGELEFLSENVLRLRIVLQPGCRSAAKVSSGQSQPCSLNQGQSRL